MSCSLCDNPNRREVSVGLVEWSKPIDDERWTAIPRCENRVACRERVEAAGESWPVREGKAA
jgi:hypothetical protein